MIWCAVHGAALSPDEGRQSQICWVARYGTWDFKRCEFVGALLIVKNGDWPELEVEVLGVELYKDEGGSGLMWDEKFRPEFMRRARRYFDALASVREEQK